MHLKDTQVDAALKLLTKEEGIDRGSTTRVQGIPDGIPWVAEERISYWRSDLKVDLRHGGTTGDGIEFQYDGEWPQ